MNQWELEAKNVGNNKHSKSQRRVGTPVCELYRYVASGHGTVFAPLPWAGYIISGGSVLNRIWSLSCTGFSCRRIVKHFVVIWNLSGRSPGNIRSSSGQGSSAIQRRGTLGGSEHRNTTKNIAKHRITARKVLKILFKIIRFYLKKISKTNTSQGWNRGYSTDAFELLLLKICYWKIIENDCRVVLKSSFCLGGTRTFPGSHFVQKLWKWE